MRKRLSIVALTLFAALSVARAKNVLVTGAIQHESLFPTADLSPDRPSWAPIEHLSNTYLDLGLLYQCSDSNRIGFNGIEAVTRLEMMQWPMPGFDAGFAGHGVGHLHLSAGFNWGRVTIGDVYGQFGSGLILRLYEERSLGIDNSLRGAKIELRPYRGIDMTLLGGKQRRYWQMYDDKAWGWNYGQDATMGANLELRVGEWSERMQAAGANLMIGGSYVSKYEQDPEMDIYTVIDDKVYKQTLPNWVGAGDVRAQLQMKGWNALVEYAYKANDPCANNQYSYAPGQTLMASLSYSRKGLSVLLQAKHSENMYFRSQRSLKESTAGYLNHLPAFTNQHTYALASLYTYATQMDGEWAFQGEVRYTCPRKTPLGGKYGTTFRLNASHVRGLGEQGGWSMSTQPEGEYYTDVNLELNKKISKKWYIGAMLMYQNYNMTKVEGHGGQVRSGIAVADVKYSLSNDIQMRAEAQYLFTKQDEGQWIFLLYELSLYKQLMISGQWQYNIGGTEESKHDHYYTAGLTWMRNAHRLMLAYTKTREGYNCSGGVCRLVPKQEGVNLTYNYSF